MFNQELKLAILTVIITGICCVLASLLPSKKKQYKTDNSEDILDDKSFMVYNQVRWLQEEKELNEYDNHKC